MEIFVGQTGLDANATEQVGARDSGTNFGLIVCAVALGLECHCNRCLLLRSDAMVDTAHEDKDESEEQ